jgi:Fe-S cluster assembly protein SufD
MSAVVDFPVKPEARPYLDAFAEIASEPDWLRNARRAGLSRFAELGFPSRRSENWRYLNLRPLEKQPLLPASGHKPTLPLDLPAGVYLRPIRTAIAERPELLRALGDDLGADHPFASLNAAFFANGFVLDVAPGIVVETPIEIVRSAGAASASLHTRGVINMGAGARATVFETYYGDEEAQAASYLDIGKYWRNDFAAWRLGEGASLTRIALVEEEPGAVHLGEVRATLGAGAKLNAFALLLGGGTVRHEANVIIAGDNAECRYDGAFVVSGSEEANIVTAVDHQAVGGTTSELIKGVAAGRGHGAFQGKIIVREGAQQTDARQTSRNLILGRRASIDTKPELEILADDVKCAHGASVGDLDEAALFYLRARGIPTDEARRLLVEGFLREPVEGIADPAIREHLLGRLSARLARLEEWA